MAQLFDYAESISKLEEALMLNPNKHDTMWCLGNAHTSLAFSIPDQDEARDSFDKASQYFQQAVAVVTYLPKPQCNKII